jgi:Flp pilus assembly protein TadB
VKWVGRRQIRVVEGEKRSEVVGSKEVRRGQQKSREEKRREEKKRRKEKNEQNRIKQNRKENRGSVVQKYTVSEKYREKVRGESGRASDLFSQPSLKLFVFDVPHMFGLLLLSLLSLLLSLLLLPRAARS